METVAPTLPCLKGYLFGVRLLRGNVRREERLTHPKCLAMIIVGYPWLSSEQNATDGSTLLLSKPEGEAPIEEHGAKVGILQRQLLIEGGQETLKNSVRDALELQNKSEAGRTSRS